MNIYLVGFMGSGKTRAGRRLAERLGVPFLDLDDEIVRQAGISIREIFMSCGEAHFRRLESEALQRASTVPGAVIALGGGAFLSEQNRNTVQSTGTSIWLDVTIDTLMDRCGNDDSRPLFKGRREMEELLELRRPFYALADIRIMAEGLPVDAVVSLILTTLRADVK